MWINAGPPQQKQTLQPAAELPPLLLLRCRTTVAKALGLPGLRRQTSARSAHLRRAAARAPRPAPPAESRAAACAGPHAPCGSSEIGGRSEEELQLRAWQCTAHAQPAALVHSGTLRRMILCP